MGLRDKISRLVTGPGAGAGRDASKALYQCYVACVRRAQDLHHHAEMAPQAYSEEALRQLAADEDKQARRLREVLQAADAAVPKAADDAPPSGAPSHWARLVRDLEAHRMSTRGLRELTVRFAETLPTTAQLFEELCREEAAHCERLRALIARADPQALD